MIVLKRLLTIFLSLIILCSCGINDTESLDETVKSTNTEFGVSIVPEMGVNPFTVKSKENLELFGLIFEGLFELDEKFEAVAVLANQYSKRDNVYTITIKGDRVFSDGTPLTAEDVAYSINLAKGEESYFSTRLANVTSVTAYGNTLTVTLANPNAKLPNLLDVPIIKKGSETGIPIGTGPYRLLYNAESKEYSLTKNTYWPNSSTLPYDNIKVVSVSGVDELVWGFESMNIDFITLDPTGTNPYQFRGDYHSTDISSTSLVHLGFNHNVRTLQNANVRRAISCAIDRKSATEQDFALMGHPATLPVHPLCRAYNEEIAAENDYSKENALTFFMEAGFKDDNNDGKLDNSYRSYTLLVNSENKSRVALSRRIAETLTNMGFKVNVREEKWDTYKRSLANGDFDMYITEVNMRADFNLDAIIRSGSYLNYGGYSSEDTNNQLLAYNNLKLTEGDDMDEFLRHLSETCPIVPILFKKHAAVTHKGFFDGITPTTHNSYYKFNSWKVVE